VKSHDTFGLNWTKLDGFEQQLPETIRESKLGELKTNLQNPIETSMQRHKRSMFFPSHFVLGRSDWLRTAPQEELAVVPEKLE
jgi:hypothetical protein